MDQNNIACVLNIVPAICTPNFAGYRKQQKRSAIRKIPRRFFSAQIILFTQVLANLRICQLLLPLQQLQQQQQSYQPSGCFLRRSDPSSLREPVQKKNLQTERQNAYVPLYRSYRRKQDLLPCCPGEEYVLYHRQKQRRSISCQLRYAIFCRYLQLDAGNESGWWSFR